MHIVSSIVVPKIYVYLEPQNVTFSGKRVFAEAIKGKTLRRNHPAFGCSLSAKTVSLQETEKETILQPRRGRPYEDTSREVD